MGKDDHIRLNMNKKNCFIKDCLFEVLVLKFNLLCSLPIYIYIYICCYGSWSHYKQSIALHVKSCIKVFWNNFMSLENHIKALLTIENLDTSPWSFVRASWGFGGTKFFTRAKVPACCFDALIMTHLHNLTY